MITAINTANRNNNINFRGKGELVKVTPFRLSKSLVEKLRTGELDPITANTIIGSENEKQCSILAVFTPIARHLGTSIEALQKHWAGIDFAEVSHQVLDLRALCPPEHKSRKYGMTLIATLPGSRGIPRVIKSFEREIIDLFVGKLGIVSRKCNFGGRLKSVTVVDGSHPIPNDFRPYAHTVNLQGGHLLDNPSRFCNLNIEGLNDPSMAIAWANKATVKKSNINGINGDKIIIEDSSMMNAYSTEHLKISGSSTIGRVKSEKSFDCQEGSRVQVNQSANCGNLNVRYGARLDVNDSIGSAQQPVKTIIIEKDAHLQADQTHADKLECEKVGQFETRVWDIKDAPFGVKLNNQIFGRLRRMGDRAMEVTATIQK